MILRKDHGSMRQAVETEKENRNLGLPGLVLHQRVIGESESAILHIVKGFKRAGLPIFARQGGSRMSGEAGESMVPGTCVGSTSKTLTERGTLWQIS